VNEYLILKKAQFKASLLEQRRIKSKSMYLSLAYVSGS